MKYILDEDDIEYLKKMLYSAKNYNEEEPEESIMKFGNVCHCDSGFFCEHRLETLIEFIKSYER